MIYSPKSKPDGTIRDWLNYHAEKSPDRICYQFSDNSSDLTWSGLLKKVISISKFLIQLDIKKKFLPLRPCFQVQMLNKSP